MVELTQEQRKVLESEIPRLVDPQTRQTYVLVNEETYERIQALLTPDRLSLTEQRGLLAAAGRRAGWDDPEMDVYDQEAEPQSP